MQARQPPFGTSTSTPVPKTYHASKTLQEYFTSGEHLVFTWKPPDLSPGSSWTRATIQTLRDACDEYVDADKMFQDELVRLD
jgi:hypothetical protein